MKRVLICALVIVTVLSGCGSERIRQRMSQGDIDEEIQSVDRTVSPRRTYVQDKADEGINVQVDDYFIKTAKI